MPSSPGAPDEGHRRRRDLLGEASAGTASPARAPASAWRGRAARRCPRHARRPRPPRARAVDERAHLAEQPALLAQHLGEAARGRVGVGERVLHLELVHRARGRASRASEPPPRASIAARTFAGLPIAMNSPTKAAPGRRRRARRCRDGAARGRARARAGSGARAACPRPARGSATSRGGPSGSSATAASSPIHGRTWVSKFRRRRSPRESSSARSRSRRSAGSWRTISPPAATGRVRARRGRARRAARRPGTRRTASSRASPPPDPSTSDATSEHRADQHDCERDAVEASAARAAAHGGVLAACTPRPAGGPAARRSRSTKSITSGTPSRW